MMLSALCAILVCGCSPDVLDERGLSATDDGCGGLCGPVLNWPKDVVAVDGGWGHVCALAANGAARSAAESAE